MSKEHLTLQQAGSVCLQCHFVEQFCELCKAEHCVCRGYKEENHPTEKTKVKGAFKAFTTKKRNKSLKQDDLISVTFIAELKDNLNDKLGRSTYTPGFDVVIWTKNTYPVTKDSVRFKEMKKKKNATRS